MKEDERQQRHQALERDAFEALQKDAGIPHPPTKETYDFRLAVSGQGCLAYQWADKPHRLLYDACRIIEREAALRQPQTDGRVADLLFKLDVAATTFEKVTTSEHREAVFNAEHAKLLRDTIKALHQPQTDALKTAREAAIEECAALVEGMGTSHDSHAGERFAKAIRALKESK
jgi:hypothetical protein